MKALKFVADAAIIGMSATCIHAIFTSRPIVSLESLRVYFVFCLVVAALDALSRLLVNLLGDEGEV